MKKLILLVILTSISFLNITCTSNETKTRNMIIGKWQGISEGWEEVFIDFKEDGNYTNMEGLIRGTWDLSITKTENQNEYYIILHPNRKTDVKQATWKINNIDESRLDIFDSFKDRNLIKK